MTERLGAMLQCATPNDAIAELCCEKTAIFRDMFKIPAGSRLNEMNNCPGQTKAIIIAEHGGKCFCFIESQRTCNCLNQRLALGDDGDGRRLWRESAQVCESLHFETHLCGA